MLTYCGVYSPSRSGRERMHIAIGGTRGIPNRYGGFEQCAQEIAPRFAAAGHRTTVFNPPSHEYAEPSYRGVEIVRLEVDEARLGPLGLFLSDWAALRECRRIEADVMLVLGHTPAGLFFSPASRRPYALVTNIDGMERWRSKFNRLQKTLLKAGEQAAVRHSDVIIADNVGIASYIRDNYDAASECIEYGAETPTVIKSLSGTGLGLEPGGYFLCIARVEPENNLEMILEGTARGAPEVPIVVIGGMNTPHSKRLHAMFGSDPRVLFAGGIYEADRLNALRYNARVYFHGHSVGGTNPALLEAMAARAPIAIHENIFNRAVVGAKTPGFRSADEVARIAADLPIPAEAAHANAERIRDHYSWDRVATLYLSAFEKAQRIHRKARGASIDSPDSFL